MKICLLTGAYPPMHCGVGDYTRWLAEALVSAGREITVLTSIPAKPDPAGRVNVLAKIRSWKLKSLWQLFSILDFLQPDVVHVQYPSLGYGRGLALNFLLPLVRWWRPHWTCVVTLHEYRIFSWFGRLRVRSMLWAAHQIICTNHQDRRCLKKDDARAGKRVKVIPLGCNFGPASNTAPPRQAKSLTHFGMVMPNKGWEYLLAALNYLAQTGLKIPLMVVGELNPQRYAYHQRIERLFNDYGLQPQIQFSGFLSPGAAAERLQSYAIAVLPFRQGASLNRSSLVTAMVLGLAVVTTRPVFPLEGLRHGIHYWLVEPDNPRALAQGIKTLWEQPELVKRLSAGAQGISQRFAWDRIARMTCQSYQLPGLRKNA